MFHIHSERHGRIFTMPLKLVLKTIGWIIVFLIISSIIGNVTQSNMDWYSTLIKSSLTPPRYVFPIAWTFLYTLLAIAGSLIWEHKDHENGKKHLQLFAGYMVMNWAWSFIFFMGHLITAGFIWIILSEIVLLLLFIVLWKYKQKVEALLILPTFLWGAFAAYLNGYIAIMS